MTELPAEARDGFERVFGYPPDGVWSAPGRVNLIGEHTDYNEGFVLPFAIDRRTYAALTLGDGDRVRVSSTAVPPDAGPSPVGPSPVGPSPADTAPGEFALSSAAPTTVGGWAAYPLGVAWALGRVGADLAALPGFDAHFVSDVPLGAGLSSSAAIESALAVALNEAWRLGFDRKRLVEAAHLAENDFVGAPTGILDQSAALLSREGAALFIDCRDGSSEPVDLGLRAAGLAVLVIDTRVRHQHVSGAVTRGDDPPKSQQDTDGVSRGDDPPKPPRDKDGYAARRASCEKAARALGVRALRDVTVPQLLAARALLDDETYRRARHVVTEDQRVLDTVAALRARDHQGVGDLMLASHQSMRDDFEISTRELDLAVETAMDAGALGARMTGGGFGGSAIALTPAGQVPALRRAIAEAFAARAYPAPETFTVTPSQGARREP